MAYLCRRFFFFLLKKKKKKQKKKNWPWPIVAIDQNSFRPRNCYFAPTTRCPVREVWSEGTTDTSMSDWNKFKNKMKEKRCKNMTKKDSGTSLKDLETIVVQRLSAEVSGKAQKYSRSGARDIKLPLAFFFLYWGALSASASGSTLYITAYTRSRRTLRSCTCLSFLCNARYPRSFPSPCISCFTASSTSSTWTVRSVYVMPKYWSLLSSVLKLHA